MIAAALALTWAAGATPAPAPATHQLYFELKLLVRGAAWTRRIAIDQWAGGRLALHETAGGGLELVVPIEDPWTFRWYPTKHEVKLGAALAVAAPAGDPYETLAARLLPEARRRYALWWDADQVADEGVGLPPWVDRVQRFWHDVHAHEQSEKDPLHDAPTYPFHVLGDAAGRLAFTRSAGGAVGAIRQHVTTPWLGNAGWRRAAAGEAVAGYGCWESRRPWWEPRTYETLAAALELLDFETLSGARAVAAPHLAAGAGRVVASLLPKYAGRFRWQGAARWETAAGRGGRVVRETGPLALAPDDLVLTAWRATLPGAAGAPPLADELQLLIEHHDPGRFRYWLRVGYVSRPSSPSTE